MNIKNIVLTGFACATLTSCNDFLDIDAPSRYSDEFVFSQESEIARALNGVYQSALVEDLYGKAYQSTFILNSDVDITTNKSNVHAHNTYSRFDCDALGGEIEKYWTAAYALIEISNRFIYGLENSELYTADNATLKQYMGEAKCLRAMAYHDLVVMFGDVPFSFAPAHARIEEGDGYLFPILDRQAIQDSLIADLQDIAPYMAYARAVTVERPSKEFAQGLIARIALTAGGYSLRPDQSNPRSYGKMERPANYLEYYQIARDYADSVISSNTHRLKAEFQDVFVNECNYRVVNDDDPIFEIPFAKNSTGNTGYLQGPEYKSYEGATMGPWGECKGSARLNAFYRFLFRDNDKRREFVNGMWYYSYVSVNNTMYDSVYIRNDYYMHNNKWSKLWTESGSALGSISTGATGINYPYMRYADILLMFAEADNELTTSPSAKAIDCLTQVHNRAFADGDPTYMSAVVADKATFKKAVLDERKWEFAGENSRWRDLVRNNLYAEEIVYSFLRYYAAGIQNLGSTTGYEDAINAHDGREYIDRLPSKIYYHTYRVTDEFNTFYAFRTQARRSQLYGCYVDGETKQFVTVYPNSQLQVFRILNAYKSATQPTRSQISDFGFTATDWYSASFYQWGNDATGSVKDECKYSFYGYVRCDEMGNLWLVDNGSLTLLPLSIPSSEELPVVRYILPYPNSLIQRSGGAYKNQYGY